MITKTRVLKGLMAVATLVRVRHGVIWVESFTGDFMVLPEKPLYSSLFLKVLFWLHSKEMFSDDWKGAWSIFLKQSMVNSKSTMEATYTNQQVRAYLREHYVQTYRRGREDHFYNHRNRQTMAVPLPEDKPFFAEHDVVQVLGGKAQHDDYIEIVRFQQFTQHQNQQV